MSENLILFLPAAVSEEDVMSWVSACPEVTHDPVRMVHDLNSGGSLYVSVYPDVDELAQGYEGADRAVFDYCISGRIPWIFGYRGTSGSIRAVVVHLAMRWPLYVDTTHNEILTGAEFTKRLFLKPGWDLKEGSESRDRIEGFLF